MFEKREILPTFDVHGDRVLFLNLVTYLKVQGYPQRMKLQRRLYQIYTCLFPCFDIPATIKLLFSMSNH